MEIKSTRSYYPYLWDNERYYYIFRMSAVLVAMGVLIIPFLIYFIHAKCTLTFTDSLQVENNQLIVRYMKFFRNREVTFPISDTILELRQYHDDVRFPPYYQMAIRYRNKIRYTVDAREGFTKETLLSFMDGFSKAQLPAALLHS